MSTGKKTITRPDGSVVVIDHDGGTMETKPKPPPPNPLNRAEARRLLKLSSKAACMMLKGNWDEASGFCIVHGLPFEELKRRVQNEIAENWYQPLAPGESLAKLHTPVGPVDVTMARLPNGRHSVVQASPKAIATLEKYKLLRWLKEEM